MMTAVPFVKPSPDRGRKHTCSDDDCMTRFYDLNRRPAACPKCNLRVPVLKAPVKRGRRVSKEMTPDEMNSLSSQAIAAEINAAPKPYKQKNVRWR